MVNGRAVLMLTSALRWRQAGRKQRHARGRRGRVLTSDARVFNLEILKRCRASIAEDPVRCEDAASRLTVTSEDSTVDRHGQIQHSATVDTDRHGQIQHSATLMWRDSPGL